MPKFKKFTIRNFIRLVKRKKKSLSEEAFEAWNAKLWSELDKDTSPYFSAKGDYQK